MASDSSQIHQETDPSLANTEHSLEESVAIQFAKWLHVLLMKPADERVKHLSHHIVSAVMAAVQVTGSHY